VARIAGVDLPREKKIEYALPYIYGIGLSCSRRILKQANVNPDTRTKDLTDDEIVRISQIIAADYKVEGDLRREVNQNIKRLMDIGCYRGLRHRRGLPARGQRTRTNSRTRKGRKKTVGAKKKATK
jgi:small subunit ribosomal protein S13